jgi:hypothetical protein
MNSTTLTVAQGSAPTLRLVLTIPDEAGERIPRDLSAVSGARFIVKDSPDNPDPAPSANYPTSITLPDPRTSGVALVTLQASDTTTPGNRFWHLDLQLGSTWTVAGHGRFHVADV